MVCKRSKEAEDFLPERFFYRRRFLAFYLGNYYCLRIKQVLAREVLSVCPEKQVPPVPAHVSPNITFKHKIGACAICLPSL